MANATVPSSLVSAGVLHGDEEFHVVDDPSGTPISKKTDVDAVLTRGESSFLLLDASNDPITGVLEISKTGSSRLLVTSETNGIANVQLKNTASQWALEVPNGGGGIEIQDITAGTSPVVVKDDAPDDSVHVTASGNVGMGTAVPVDALHVHDSVVSSFVRCTHSSTGATSTDGMQVGYSNACYLWNYENTDVVIAANNAVVARFQPGGDLRIEGALEVAGSGGPTITAGSGTPESVLTAPVGSLFQRTDGGAGTSFYVKESGAGNTGWVAK